jgi:hypothetical protein
MLNSWRERLKTFTSASETPVDRHVADLVARSSSELLIAPDWAVNMELVDVINYDPR